MSCGDRLTFLKAGAFYVLLCRQIVLQIIIFVDLSRALLNNDGKCFSRSKQMFFQEVSNVKIVCIAAAFFSFAADLIAQEPEKTEGKTVASRIAGTMKPSRSLPLNATARGDGLAPTSWGLISKYSGTRYGSGYLLIGIDETLYNTNYLVGYSFSYPSFTNHQRTIYTFDVSSLAGLPGPIWSSFMFDVRERPSSGSSGYFLGFGIHMTTDGDAHTLNGLHYSTRLNAAHLDIYNAEELESAKPFVSPELAFTGVNPLLGSVAVADDITTTFSFDVTAAVNEDLSQTVPTLGETAMVAFLLLLGVAGLCFIRRHKARFR